MMMNVADETAIIQYIKFLHSHPLNCSLAVGSEQSVAADDPDGVEQQKVRSGKLSPLMNDSVMEKRKNQSVSVTSSTSTATETEMRELSSRRTFLRSPTVNNQAGVVVGFWRMEISKFMMEELSSPAKSREEDEHFNFNPLKDAAFSTSHRPKFN